MMGILYDVCGVLIVLGTLVLVHEWGHYAAAKLFGVRVEVFSIGFGKRLWGFKRGDTDYRVSALPLGGYVRMAGENPMEESTGDPHEFMAHPRWQRFIIALAGPAMNVLFALALLTGLYTVHYEDAYYLSQPALIGWVAPETPAANVGLQSGDRIARINGAANPNWETVIEAIALAGNQPLHLEIQRGSTTENKVLYLNTSAASAQDTFGALPVFSYTARAVLPGSAGESAGMKVGDELVSIDDKPVVTVENLVSNMQATKDKPLRVVVKRGGAPITLTVVPKPNGVQGYRMGVSFGMLNRVERLSLAEAWRHSLRENGRNSFLVVATLRELVRSQVSIRQMSGPIGIAQISGEAIQAGPYDFFNIMALISVNLGIFNLLPIPILDGGLILLILIESVLRRDIKREVKELVYQAAFALIVLFAVVVIYNDIAKTALGRFLHLG
jgi:regulator of sigma E protease